MIELGTIGFSYVERAWQPIHGLHADHVLTKKVLDLMRDDLWFLKDHGIRLIAKCGFERREVKSFDDILYWRNFTVTLQLRFDDSEKETLFRLKYL